MTEFIQIDTALIILCAMVCLTVLVVVWKLCKSGVDVVLSGDIKVFVGRNREDD